MKLFDAIWYNGGRGPADGNNYWRRLAIWHYVWVGVLLTALSAAAGSLALVVGGVYPGIKDASFQWSYFSEPWILFLNILPVLLLTAALYFSTGRAWIAYLGSSFTVLALAIVDFYKLAIRNETFKASDLGLVGEAAGIISNYTIVISGRAVISILAVVLGTALAAILARGALKKVWVRVVGAVLSLGVLVTLIFTLYASDAVYDRTVNNTAEYNVWVEQQVYASKGFLYSFLRSISEAIPKPPEGYDEDEAAEMLAGYSDGSIEEERRVNLIAVMLEAYCDLSEYPQIGVDEDVYAPLHELQAESLHGHIVSNTFGGGTVDSERCFLTGFAEMEEFREKTDSYAWFLRRNGYYAEGLHPGNNWYYNRENVERNLGFEKYYFLEDFGTGDRSDSFFFSELTELIENRDKSVPYFNYSISFQNHGGYDSASTGEKSYLVRGDKPEPAYNTVNNYLTGIADTSRRMLDFVNSLRDDPEPFVVVFYGDHKPYLGTAFDELGVNLDLGTGEGFYNYCSTPYLIWANDAARRATGGDFTGEGGDVSACFLMDKVFEECGWGRSAYGQILHDAARRVSAINTTLDVSVVDGQILHELAGEQRELVNGVLYAGYYTKEHFSYGELLGD